MEHQNSNVEVKKEMQNKIGKQGGFTMLEILISAVIIAIVINVVGPTMTETKDKNVTVGQEISLMNATVNNIDDRYFNENITTDS